MERLGDRQWDPIELYVCGYLKANKQSIHRSIEAYSPHDG